MSANLYNHGQQINTLKMVIISEATEHDEQVVLAEDLLEKEDYRGAAHEAGKVLEALEPHLPTIAQAALTQGRALMTEAMVEMSKTGEIPSREIFDKVWGAYELSQLLNPECEESEHELTKISRFLRQIPPPEPPKDAVLADFDVLVVGAGAAGIGCALMLTETFGLDKKSVVLMERGAEVGESFRRWPAEMKFISPSFNQKGWTDSFDLNSISNDSSPAFSLHSEHPSGTEYATYLEAIAKTNKLNVRTLTEVVSVRDVTGSEEQPLFSVDVKSLANEKTETLTARYIVWAAGEFQYPRATSSNTKEEEKKSEDGEGEKESEGLPGSELCVHNSEVRSWAKVPGEEFLVIGGYESGVDAAINLARAGKRCKVLASTPCWSVKTTDPSAELAPYTAGRLRDVLAPGFSPQPQLLAPLRVIRVEKAEEGGFNVTAEWKAVKEAPEEPSLRNLSNHADATEAPSAEGSTLVLHTPNPPVLCTGFEGSVAAAASHLFEFASDDGSNDEDNDEDNDGKMDNEEDENKDNEEDETMDDEKMENNDKSNDEDKDNEEDEAMDDESQANDRKGCLAGAPLLTEDDESTKIPGVFLVGPTVSQGKHSFCFVYKFRQRFGVVSNAICKGLGIDTRAAVTECRKANMYLDDLGCCEDTCGDVC